MKKIVTKNDAKYLAHFYEIISRMRSPEALMEFISGFFTDSEKLMFARRFMIAKRIQDGISYRRIQDELRVGLDTIVFVRRWLDGKTRGSRLPKKGSVRTRSRNTGRGTGDFQKFLNKYPGRNMLLKLMFGKDNTK